MLVAARNYTQCNNPIREKVTILQCDIVVVPSLCYNDREKDDTVVAGLIMCHHAHANTRAWRCSGEECRILHAAS